MNRPKRSPYRINEDNATGFHQNAVINGVHRQVTGGNDAPLPVDLPELKKSIKQTAKIITGKGGGDNTINQTININYDQGWKIAKDGLGFFLTNWKTVAIVACAAAVIAAIAALIKGMNRSIKVRYNKVVKTLQRAQKDFTTNEMGLNMATVMPGVGSKIMDAFSRLWTWNFKAKRKSTGNIGLFPFCRQYIDEIGTDFKMAQDAFNKIKLADGEKSGDRLNGSDKKKVADAEGKLESFGMTKTYNSFREAYRDELINEGYTEERLNEALFDNLSDAFDLAKFKVKSGSFFMSKFKDGKPVLGTGKIVNVTPESTREICYTIINNFADKYINMKQVFKALGIDTNSLADLDKSSCDKLANILEKYSKPEKNSYTKQYSRIKTAYEKMLKHYYAIGDGIINNFSKYTKAEDEKHENLLVSAKEKLQNMWDSQKDFYDNNFSHIVIEIVSCDAYQNYLNFILKYVIPVFKSGLAGDADYVLDIVPKKDECYILRQTQNNPILKKGQSNEGKVAIAKVISFDKDNKKITFELVGLLEDNPGYKLDGDGIATITSSVDFDAYKVDGESKPVDLDYGKWMSLDPVMADWTPMIITDVYKKNADDDSVCCVYAECERETNKNVKTVSIIKYKGRDIVSKDVVSLNFEIGKDEFVKFLNYDLGFSDNFNDDLVPKLKRAEPTSDDEKVSTSEELKEKIDKVLEKTEDEEKKTPNAESKLYRREGKDKRGNDVTEYIFAEVLDDLESVRRNTRDVLNEEGEDDENNDSDNDNNDNDSNNTDSETPDIIDPDTDEAKNKNVTSIVYCTVLKDKKLNDPSNESKFIGSYIYLKNPCSIDEFDKKMTDDGFSIFEEGTNKDKKLIRENINKAGGQTSVKDIEINSIADTIDEIRNRSTSSDDLYEKSGELAREIYDKTKNINILNDFGHKSIPQAPNSGFMQNISKHVYTGDGAKGGYFAVPTGIKNKSGDEINIYVYPILVKKDDVKKINVDDLEKTAELRIYLFLGKDFHQTALNDEADIKAKIDLLVKSLIEKKKIDDARFGEVEATAKSEGNNNGEADPDFDKKLNQDITTMVKMIPVGSYDDEKTKQTVKFRYFATLNKDNVVVTDTDEKLPNQEKTYIVQFKDLKDVKFNLKFSEYKDSNIRMTVGLEGEQPKEISINELFDLLKNKYGNKADKTGDENKAAEQQNANTNTDNQQPEQPKQESVNVDYYTESANESVTVHRTFDRNMKGYYIVTESYYDNADNRTSKLDNPRFIKKLTEKSQLLEFAKSDINVNMVPFTKSSTISVVSNTNLKPAIHTPLYESTILVKFDSDDNVTDIITLPKQKLIK